MSTPSTGQANAGAASSSAAAAGVWGVVADFFKSAFEVVGIKIQARTTQTIEGRNTVVSQSNTGIIVAGAAIAVIILAVAITAIKTPSN